MIIKLERKENGANLNLLTNTAIIYAMILEEPLRAAYFATVNSSSIINSDISISMLYTAPIGQMGTIRLTKLIWFPQKHRIIPLRAEKCRQCQDQVKNFNPPTQILTWVLFLNLMHQTKKSNWILLFPYIITQNNIEQYILVSVDRFPGHPAALVYTNCDTQTVIDFSKRYCAFHCIPRSIRYDQAQAFKI